MPGYPQSNSKIVLTTVRQRRPRVLEFHRWRTLIIRHTDVNIRFMIISIITIFGHYFSSQAIESSAAAFVLDITILNTEKITSTCFFMGFSAVCALRTTRQCSPFSVPYLFMTEKFMRGAISTWCTLETREYSTTNHMELSRITPIPYHTHPYKVSRFRLVPQTVHAIGFPRMPAERRGRVMWTANFVIFSSPIKTSNPFRKSKISGLSSRLRFFAKLSTKISRDISSLLSLS